MHCYIGQCNIQTDHLRIWLCACQKCSAIAAKHTLNSTSAWIGSLLMSVCVARLPVLCLVSIQFSCTCSQAGDAVNAFSSHAYKMHLFYSQPDHQSLAQQTVEIKKQRKKKLNSEQTSISYCISSGALCCNRKTRKWTARRTNTNNLKWYYKLYWNVNVFVVKCCLLCLLLSVFWLFLTAWRGEDVRRTAIEEGRVDARAQPTQFIHNVVHLCTK